MKYFNLQQLTGALVLTYSNALCGVFGIIALVSGHVEVALVLLIVAALCDAFDGVVARLQQQTAAQKTLGTIADSVADMVSFGVLPVVVFISLASLNVVTGIVVALYVFAAIHRLVVFTADALRTQQPTRHFTGLPVVMGAVMMPILYALFGSLLWFPFMMTAVVFVLAALFVSKLSIPKPHGPIAYVSYLSIAAIVMTSIIL